MSHGSYFKIENLSSDIIEAAKKIVLQRQKDEMQMRGKVNLEQINLLLSQLPSSPPWCWRSV